MKPENKYIKYGLLAGVVTVWGIIGWRVISGLQTDKPHPAAVRADVPVAFDPAPDTFTLRADYPDPFLPTPDSTDMEEGKGMGASGSGSGAGNGGLRNNVGVGGGGAGMPYPAGPVTPPEPFLSWFQFNGLIQSGHKKVAIVTIHGNEYLAKEQQKVQDVFFVRIAKEEIRVRYKGEGFRVKRQ